MFQEPKPHGANPIIKTEKDPTISVSNCVTVKKFPISKYSACPVPQVLENSAKEKHNIIRNPNVQNKCIKQTMENGNKQVESHKDEAFGEDDDFDTLLSQMEMPGLEQYSNLSNPSHKISAQNTQKFSTGTGTSHVSSASHMLPEDSMSKVCLFQFL